MLGTICSNGTINLAYNLACCKIENSALWSRSWHLCTLEGARHWTSCERCAGRSSPHKQGRGNLKANFGGKPLCYLLAATTDDFKGVMAENNSISSSICIYILGVTELTTHCRHAHSMDSRKDHDWQNFQQLLWQDRNEY